MKPIHILTISGVLLAATSCAPNIEQFVGDRFAKEITFEASFADDTATKTSVQSDGASVWWSAHESINIFYGNSESSLFTSTNDEPVARAQFRGMIPAFTGETEGGGISYFWAIYPYNADNTCDGSSVTATLPANQLTAAETFADRQWLTIAKSQGLSLSFYAVGAGFRFSITKEGVKSVTFRGNNNEVLAGKARITMDGNNRPVIQEYLEPETEITLSAPAGETLEVGTLYYFTFFPNNFENGFTITFNTATETGTRVYNAAVNFNRTDVHRGRNFDANVTYRPTLVPFEDTYFKAYCVQNFDTDEDGEISIEEAKAVTEISVYTNNISSLKGIEYFTNLEILSCCPQYNMYSTDITRREEKYYYNGAEVIGQLKSLDISDNKQLRRLTCWGNQLQSLNISECEQLSILTCYCNQLTHLDISNNPALTSLSCGYNDLPELIVSGNTLLTSLGCEANLITDINIKNNTALETLYCGGNDLESLDVSSNLALVALHCGYNRLISLDVSNNTELKHLYITNNQLNEINISNNDKLVSFFCDNNELTNLNISNNPWLEYFNCNNNKLTSLDLSVPTRLYDFYCMNNLLTALDLSNQTRLDRLQCGNNQLSSLRLSENISADIIDCKNNLLTGLDVSNKSISKLDLSGNTLLTTIQCFDCNLTSLDINGCSSLEYLNCENNNLKNLNTSSNSLLVNLNCPGNKITELDVSFNSNLNYLNCSNNPNLATLWLMTGQTIDQLFYNSNITSINYKGTNLNIVFSDANVKAICVEHWDANDDGEISFVEAAAVTSFDDYFSNHSEIITFDEIEYFINVKSLADSSFYGCDHLTSFVIPDQVTTIGDGAFLGCQALGYIKFGSGVSSIGDKILNPEYIRTLVVSENNTTFDSRNNCNALVRTMTNTLLYGGRNSTIPEGIITIAEHAFAYSRLTDFTLPSTLKHIGQFAFGGYNEYKYITCLAPIPPLLDFTDNTNWHPFISSILFSFETIIRVPDDNYAAYQEAWGTYQSITIERIE